MKIWPRRNNGLDVLKRALGSVSTFSATKFDIATLSTEKITFKNALVLSPHPHDDCFGLGGTIKKLTTAGADVRVVYLTDGGAGISETEEKKNPVTNRDLIAVRKAEANKSAEILSLTENFFYGEREGRLASGYSSIRALGDLIKKISPDVIFVPSFLDNHPDHRSTNEIFINAVSSLGEEQKIFEVWLYESWTPILPNRLIDITLYIKTKEEAMKAHQSQLSGKRYDEAIISLNKYRAEINGIHGFTEAFFAAPFLLYKELYEKS